MALAVLLCASCGSGVETGAALAWSVLGGGPDTADASAESAPAEDATPVPVSIPPPIRPIPSGAVYAAEALVRMRGATGVFKRAAIWSREFNDKPVAGQGTITKIHKRDFYGALQIEVWLDLDGDETVDAIVNFMNPDDVQILGAQDGQRVWFEGTLKRYQERLMIAGDVMEVFW